ncbi:hypothetical protein E2C01_067807 [Portunus trituberculatus]|uniref:Uncharacterized protein n=1 Tax=Portunus trituberculatus TaxID=210409 RepID=A0A5B7HUT5_PORTR|nr:hypothetical protein [Portunus trituberculatus]
MGGRVAWPQPSAPDD